ncbi:hypothetical protein PAXRUDRAFT_17046 [Paxillus rubicundulus Ve08.2h10]|uniref:Uncharacterized protein n=1 Tax=Paxillus rubicundulus Ve08.2h10 TaxID=930991 RepID=A0A0D0DBX1_9AGAM|nr:hypothetical protein PAXRUDRAFT_17046 [Paxillus rubicundulus Ve08.2h10]
MLEPTVRGSAEHSRRNLHSTLEPLDIEFLTVSFCKLQVTRDSLLHHPDSPITQLSPDSCLPFDICISPTFHLSPVSTRLGDHSAEGNISDPPGTPEQIVPDYLDFSPFIPGMFCHSTPPHNPLESLLLSPGSPLSPLTPSLSGSSLPSPLTQFDLRPPFLLSHNNTHWPTTDPLPSASSSNACPVPRPAPTPANLSNHPIVAPHLPILVAQPPAQPPMAAPFTMPLRGTKDAPKFLGKITAELPCFLEDVSILADQAQLDDAGKIHAAICYAALDEAELWETLDSATTVLAVWADFVTAVKQLYLGCKGADRYYCSDLHNLVQEYRVKPMKNREELGEYHRKFQKVAAHLISMAKLSYKVPDVHPSDPYPMTSTLEATNFCLTGASLRLAYSPYGYNQPPQPFQQQPASAQPRNSVARPQTTGQTGTLSPPSPAPGTVVKQEYPVPGSQAPRIATCAFCQDSSHFVPNSASTKSTPSSSFVRDPPPHITATLYTTAYGDDNGLETELEIEPSAFLHTSYMSLHVPDSSEVADPEFQPFLANTWVNFQAGKGKGDQSNGKKTRFNGVEPANPASVAQSNGQFRYLFPLADSEAPKRALDQVLGMTVPVPLKELLALSPDLRKHMKEAVMGKRVWGNLLTQARSETSARADISANCFELEG